MTERWLPIPNFPLYEISSMGRVKSRERTYQRMDWRGVSKQNIIWMQRILGGWVHTQNGKPVSRMVALRKDGKTYCERVHRLVLNAFVGKQPPGMECCHWDGNCLNNHLENLRWDTHLSNQQDSIRHGTKVNPPVHYGERHHNATLTDKQIQEIRDTPVCRGTKAALARIYHVTQTSIGRYLNGISRKTNF